MCQKRVLPIPLRLIPREARRPNAATQTRRNGFELINAPVPHLNMALTTRSFGSSYPANRKIIEANGLTVAADVVKKALVLRRSPMRSETYIQQLATGT
jgi:hypothetical protein